MFKQELKQSIFNKRMLITIIVYLFFLFLSAYNMILSSAAFFDTSADDLTPEGIDYLFEIGRNKYHIWARSYSQAQPIAILAIVFPYTASYIVERNQKFHYFSIIRSGEKRYRLRKFIANGMAGGLALFIPECIYYLILSLTARNTVLHPFTYKPQGLFSELFPHTPDIYIWIVFGMHFILGFCFAAFALGITSFLSKPILVYLIPFALLVTYDVCMEHLFDVRKYGVSNMYNFMTSATYSLLEFFLVMAGLLLLGGLAFYVNYRRVLKYG
ncbi:hypothetical protein [Paenibacillus popilliae]|uniref:ABC-2 family transporter protein n=1 Tax=Paenibacillus popilliae ATCC 14706 TaxID=1212764 RepID=M9LCE3_PAEPP|nr:hypothetical protein [Paenibacillus popilliae]GAC43737.1 hypothetical protein PPOP_3137 [Paenibacillus popilliae ATCC 14706]